MRPTNKRDRDCGCEAIEVAAVLVAVSHESPAAQCYQAEPNHIQRGAKASGYIYLPALVTKTNPSVITVKRSREPVMKSQVYLCILAITLGVSSMAQAQATRTWVSGVGDDANPCSRTAPCKTFPGAISKTAAGGEIDVLDPGGFGAVTITKSITIDGGGGVVASSLVSGTNGVVINAQPNDVITLRNLSITGSGSGINGVRFLAGRALHIEHCVISGFTNHGIDIELVGGGFVFVEDTTSQDNVGSGLSALSTGTPVQVSIDNSRFDNNSVGVSALDFTFFSVTNSEASGNSQVGFLAQANGGSAAMSMANSAAGNNVVGIKAGGGSSPSSIRMAGVSVFLNATGLMAGTNGVIASFGNNYNSGSGTPTAHIVPQ